MRTDPRTHTVASRPRKISCLLCFCSHNFVIFSEMFAGIFVCFSRGSRGATMEDNKGSRAAGTKVSQIANIFQGRTHREDIIIQLRNKPKSPSPTSDKRELDSPTVTVMRTESHVARFNNARALFEKLGEENRGATKEKFNPLQTTKSASNIQDSRSRSSSVNSENKDTSRSPSPKRDKSEVFSKVLPSESGCEPNGHAVTGSRLNGEDRAKPALMKKPDKPERKFNSKELIEKQRNWTSHFSKTRPNRCNSDPSKTDVKLAVSNGRNFPSNPPATRSASFNTRLQTPPTSPTEPDIIKRNNISRRERPVSVIPHMTENTKQIPSPQKETYQTSPIKESKNIPKETKRNSWSPIKEPTKKTSSESICNDRNARKFRKSSDASRENSPPKTPDGGDVSGRKSTSSMEQEETVDELSVVDSLSTSTSPSCRSEAKSEHEKQENEDDEKHSFGELFAYYLFVTKFEKDLAGFWTGRQIFLLRSFDFNATRRASSLSRFKFS